MTGPDLPARAVACDTCGAEPGDPCTSHSGTRIRWHDVHQTRTRSYAKQLAGGGPASTIRKDHDTP